MKADGPGGNRKLPTAGHEGHRELAEISVAARRAKSVDGHSRLALGRQSAIRWTKYALNNWLRQAGPIVDTSLALEFMGFAGPGAREGVASLRERRPPRFGAGEPA